MDDPITAAFQNFMREWHKKIGSQPLNYSGDSMKAAYRAGIAFCIYAANLNDQRLYEYLKEECS